MKLSKTIPFVVAFAAICGCQNKSAEAPADSEPQAAETALEAPPAAPAPAEGANADCRGDADCLAACKDAGDEIATCAAAFWAVDGDAEADNAAEPEESEEPARLEAKEEIGGGAAQPAKMRKKMKSSPAPSAPSAPGDSLKGTGSDEDSVRPHEYSD